MSFEPLHNEKILFLQITEGDEQAYRAVFHHYYPRLLPFVAKITKESYAAEEICQEIFLRLWRHRHSFTQTEYLGAWLFKVGTNLSYDFLKKAAKDGRLIRSLMENSPEAVNKTLEQLDEKDNYALIHEVVKNLPGQQQRVYKLSREEGLSLQQIAEQLNISPNTAKNHLVKALQTIRRFLEASSNLFFSFLFIFFGRH